MSAGRRLHRSAAALVMGVAAALLVATHLESDSRADVTAQTSANSLEIRGSGSFLPLAQRVAEVYMQDHPGSAVVVTSGGNRRGIKSLILGTCEMAMAGMEIPDDLASLAASKKVELESDEIYQDAVVVVVHPKNPVRDLSMKQLHDIFRGAIVNWKEVGGNDAPILVISQSPNSGVYDIFKYSVLGDDAVITPDALVTKYEALTGSMTENGIGYTDVHDFGALRPLTVGGIPSDAVSIKAHKYPIRRTLRLYQRKPVSQIGRDVLSYFRSPDKGRVLVRQLGDVPVE